MHEPLAEEQSAQSCFLCAIDPHVCAVERLEGRIVAVGERELDGETLPWVTLQVGESYASIILTRDYRELIKSLRVLGKSLERCHLSLRVYHLPSPARTTMHGERSVERYRANVYTLAVLEPETILNITDLNQAEYCARQYLLGRLAPSGTSPAALRGNLVHTCFKELLKEQDRSRHTRGQGQHGQEEPLDTLQRHLESELTRVRIDLALLNTSAEEMRAEVAPHLASLANWFNRQRTTLWDLPTEDDAEDAEARSENMVRAETFLLAPEIGLRGRLDLLWQQNGRRRLLELKTGGASGSLPRSAHKWQVQGYHALLMVRRESRMKKALATLLYSGTPQEAQDFGIPFTIRQLQRVNATRNTLVLSHVTGVPPAPPGVSRCTKCAMLDQCSRVSDLLDWEPPHLPESEAETAGGEDSSASTRNTPDIQAGGKEDAFVSSLNPSATQMSGDEDHSSASSLDVPAMQISPRLRSDTSTELTPDDREFFALYYRLLQQEGREIEQQQAQLWQTPVAARVERGSAISDLIPLGEPVSTEQGEWQQTFRCLNTSELREGDEILLSDGNPVTGEVVTGTILGVSSEQVRVWTPELIARPSLLDRYDTSIVHVRTLQNLLRWLQADEHLRGLVSGTLTPRFARRQIVPRPDFNDEQNLAVARALQMRDYLLVHGPPGTGKTSVIAEIVKRLCQRGERVLLAGFTNQAVDNMLQRLNREGFHDYIRLGHERSVDEAVRPRLLQVLSQAPAPGATSLGSSEIREIVRRSPVVASTTATWSSDKYAPLPPALRDVSEGALFQFDVALIDEAGQLTIPAILGALRFARRFILVGDEKQLPPLVLDKAAGAQGLAVSLFDRLKQLDEERQQTSKQTTTSACVPLRVQYRMHEIISNFASSTFYHNQLRAHYAVARRRLQLLNPLPGGVPVHGAVLQVLRADRPMTFLDVQARASTFEVKMSNAEARVVREIIAALLARGVAEDEIGVIAPYRAQVANLRRHLFSDDASAGWTALPIKTPLSIDTVDRFQGGERSVIIISFATSTTPPVGSQLREHLTNAHRLNVALTRAQRKLILVGNTSALADMELFQRLLAYCREQRTLFSYTTGPQEI